MYFDFEEFIHKIDLREYVISRGYEFNKRKSTVKWKVYRHPQTDDLIELFIHRNSDGSYFSYRNLRDPSDCGNIINFCMNRINGVLIPGNQVRSDYEEVTKLLMQYLNIPIDERPKITETEKKAVVDDGNKKFDYFLFDARQVTDNVPYLDERGISKKVYLSDLFNKRMCLVRPIWENKDGTIRQDANELLAFPLFYGGAIVGLEYRYPDKKIFAKYSNREQGLWFSKPSSVANIMCVGESPIDCMSHYVLNNYNRCFCYVATCGQPSGCHYEIIDNYVRHNNYKEVMLINDNDKAGQLFNLRYMSYAFRNHITLHVNSLMNNKMSIELNMNDFSQTVCRKLIHDFKVYNDREKFSFKQCFNNENDHFSFLNNNLIKPTRENDSSKLTVLLPYNVEALSIINDFIVKLKVGDYKISICRSVGKDWNDDLKMNLSSQKQNLNVSEHSAVKTIEKQEVKNAKGIRRNP